MALILEVSRVLRILSLNKNGSIVRLIFFISFIDAFYISVRFLFRILGEKNIFLILIHLQIKLL